VKRTEDRSKKGGLNKTVKVSGHLHVDFSEN
jgi:hypothetical protein